MAKEYQELRPAEPDEGVTLDHVTQAAVAIPCNNLDDFEAFDNREKDNDQLVTNILEMFKELQSIKHVDIWYNPKLIQHPLLNNLIQIPEQFEFVESP